MAIEAVLRSCSEGGGMGGGPSAALGPLALS